MKTTTSAEGQGRWAWSLVGLRVFMNIYTTGRRPARPRQPGGGAASTITAQ